MTERARVDECSQSRDTSAQRTRHQEISFIPRQLSVCTLHKTATREGTDAPTFPDQTRSGHGGGGQLDTAQKETDMEMGMGKAKAKQTTTTKKNPLPRSQQPPQPSRGLDMVGAQKTKRAPEIPKAGPE